MTTSTSSRSRDMAALFSWLALTFCASATAVFVTTGGWYAALNKPAWNPPSWLFGPAWTLLYTLMAVAAWLVWKQGGWKSQKKALSLYLLQWALNALWTPLFFGLHLPGPAFAELLALDLAVLATLRAFWPVSRPAAWLLVPYACWIAFASALNFTIWRLNP